MSMSDFALHLVVDDLAQSATWYQAALGATLIRTLQLPDGTPVIVDLDLHGLPVSLAEAVPGTSLASPSTSRTSVGAYRLSVEDADAAMRRALAAGATLETEVPDAFWGARPGEVLDPSGHRWAFDQHLRDVPTAEVQGRLAELLADG